MATKTRTYEMLWRNKWITADAESIDDMIAMLSAAIGELREMKAAGLKGDFEGAGDDYIFFRTTDSKVAEKFGLYELEDDEQE